MYSGTKPEDLCNGYMSMTEELEPWHTEEQGTAICFNITRGKKEQDRRPQHSSRAGDSHVGVCRFESHQRRPP